MVGHISVSSTPPRIISSRILIHLVLPHKLSPKYCRRNKSLLLVIPPRMIYPKLQRWLFPIDFAIKAYRCVRPHIPSQLLWVPDTPPHKLLMSEQRSLYPRYSRQSQFLYLLRKYYLSFSVLYSHSYTTSIIFGSTPEC